MVVQCLAASLPVRSNDRRAHAGGQASGDSGLTPLVSSGRRERFASDEHRDRSLECGDVMFQVSVNEEEVRR